MDNVIFEGVEDGFAYKVVMDEDRISDLEQTSKYEISSEMRALLDGKTDVATLGSEYAYRVPVDHDISIIFVGENLLGKNGSDIATFIVDAAFNGSRHFRPVALYSVRTDDLLVVNNLYKSALIRGDSGYDRGAFARLQKEVGEIMIRDHIDGHIAERLSDAIELGNEALSEEYLHDITVDEMLANGIQDAFEIDTSSKISLNELVSVDKLMSASGLLNALRGNLQDIANEAWSEAPDSYRMNSSKSSIIGQRFERQRQWNDYITRHCGEINEAYGWRVELSQAIKQSGAKSVTVHLAECEIDQLKIPTQELQWHLRHGELGFLSERQKLGTSYSDICDSPEPIITVVQYRGKDIWQRTPTPEHEITADRTSFASRLASAKAAAAAQTPKQGNHDLTRDAR